MNGPVLMLGPLSFGAAEVVLAAGVLLIVFLCLALRSGRSRAEIDARMAEMVRMQSELSGRLQTIAEVFGSRQVELVRALNERLDSMSSRIGQNLDRQARHTGESLAQLQERLAVIDAAQRHISDLSKEVVSLQDILSNKQARGAFGEGRLEAIISDALPPSAYSFQATLSNGRRPDCLIRLPNDAAALVIDAKFPLEAWTAMRGAKAPHERKAAAAQFRQHVIRHVLDIRERYFIAGETQETALMFVPSESVHAELHEDFEDVIQRAYRARVVIVSPSLLMLSIQVMQALMRDQRMREQAGVIQREVMHLLRDTEWLRERALNLRKHFGQACADIDQLLTSTERIARRGGRIEALDLEDGPHLAVVQGSDSG